MSKQTSATPTGAFALLPKSIELIRNNMPTFAFVYSVPMILGILPALNNSKTTTTSTLDVKAVLGVSAGLGALLLVASLVFQTMAVGLELAVAQGKKPTMGDLWDIARKYTFRYLGLSILYGLSVIVGLILLIVPGFIMIRRYSLAAYLMIDKDLGIIDAMKQSAALTKPYSGAVWSVILVTLLFGIISSILSGIFSLPGAIAGTLLVLLYSVAPALRYLELKKLSA